MEDPFLGEDGEPTRRPPSSPTAIYNAYKQNKRMMSNILLKRTKYSFAPASHYRPCQISVNPFNCRHRIPAVKLFNFTKQYLYKYFDHYMKMI